jgi:hypothetical protein
MADIGRIKSNIQIMIDKGASEAEIDSYISSEGVSLGQLQQAPVPQDSVASQTGGFGSLTPAEMGQGDDYMPHPPATAQEKKRYGYEGPYSSSIWPVSRDARGEVGFDSDAGILGMAKRTFMLPGQVWQRKIDPTSDEGMRRTVEAAMLMTPLGAASRAARGTLGTSAYKQPQKVAPTREALGQATTAGYKRLEQLDVHYSASAVERMVTNLENSLNKEGFIPKMKGVGDIHSLIGNLKGGPKGSSVRMRELETVRQRLGDIAGSPKRQVQKAAKRAIDALDDFIASTNPSNLAGRSAARDPGTGIVPQGFSFSSVDAAANKALAKEASDIVLKARGNAAAGFRSDAINELRDIMRLRTAAANSGMNLDNTTRSKLVSMLTSKGGKGVRGFSDAEKDAIREIIIGTPSKNALRKVGNMLGGGGGLGQTLVTTLPALGAAIGGGGPKAIIAATIPGMVGALSKGATNRIAGKEIGRLDDTIRKRSPLHKQTPPPAPVYKPSVGKETMIRALGGAAVNSYDGTLDWLWPAAEQAGLHPVGPNGGYMVNGKEYF